MSCTVWTILQCLVLVYVQLYSINRQVDIRLTYAGGSESVFNYI